MKRCLIVRYGAYGDCIIISPILKKLKEQGYYIILDTTVRGLDVFKHDPNIDEFIEHDETIPVTEIYEFWEKQKKDIPHDLYINFSESIEMNLATHQSDPLYWEPKYVRAEKCNKNYYKETARWAGVELDEYRPVLYFTKEEEKAAQVPVEKDKFNILWCLSGSGKNKAYPWTEYVMLDLLKKYKDIQFITIGDKKCQQIETENPKITRLSGRIPMRLSMCMTKHTDLVVSPDTGVLHASGGYTTPKIGLLGHTTIKNITETFENDYSLEAECACAPCFRLIFDQEIQCPMNPVTHSPWCLSEGIPPERLFKQIERVYREHHTS